MADANYYYAKYQQQNQGNPSKFYTNFLYKALIVSVFLAILPHFPSQAPEFINQTLNTRGWEFLHLVFVGIAVSYGLFSKRNDESEKENNVATSNNATPHSKFDNAQSYVSRFLQVSSVFDDDIDSPSKSEENKVQTWNSQYYRSDPVVVVAEENSVLDKQHRGTNSKLGEKPLLLPVRSLKSRVVDADVNGSSEESIGVSRSISRSNSNSGSKRFSSNSIKNKKGDFGGLGYQESEEKLKDNVVLPSPIPWRSRSGRMEMKEEADSPPPYTLPPSMEESEYNRSFKAQVPRSARSSSATSSPKLSPSRKKFSPCPSSDVQGQIAEDFVRKKSVYKSPPPPPPPPPPPVIRKSSSLKPSSSAINDEAFLERRLKRSFTSEPKSVRTLRSDDPLGGNNRKAERGLNEVEASALERTGRKTAGFDQSPFKTESLKRESVTFMPEPTFMEFPEEEREENVEKLVMESDGESEMETEEEEEEEGEGGDIAGSSFASGIAASPKKAAAASSSASDGGPDVDKKADEFIAKFREQIRLQRIESIKRTSAQIRRNPSR